jgi:amino acid adenylation domain-containing protein
MSMVEDELARLPLALRIQLERRVLRAGRAVTAAKIPSRKPGEPSPLSFSQQRLWFLDQYEPGSPVYNVSKAFRLHGALHVQTAGRALTAVVARHETLRTTFATLDDEPVQRVSSPPSAVPLPVVDLTGSSPDQRDSNLQRLIFEEARRPFDLSQDLMLRARLYRLDDRDFALHLTTHHIVSDASSMEILLREFSAFYSAFFRLAPPPLSALTLQYADYAIWQRQCLSGTQLNDDVAYWKEQLRGIPTLLELPTDYPRPAVETFRGQRLMHRLPLPLTAALKRVARGEGVTLFMTLLGAFQLLLGRYSGQDDVVVGSPIGGRGLVELEVLIGLFVNTLPLRTNLAGDPTFRELLSRVREVTLGAYTHQDLPFEKLVEELRPPRRLSHSPIYQVMFSAQDPVESELQLPGITAVPIPLDPGTAKFDLTVFLFDRDDELEVCAEYRSDLFREATIHRMLGHFTTLLEAVAADPDRSISTLPLLKQTERQQLLAEWAHGRGADQEPPARSRESECFHARFEAQARRTPERLALVFGDVRFTYRELNEDANRLARFLCGLGVGPEVVVGLCLNRSPSMVLALLAIAKAGGAYVPLDPQLPVTRRTFILDDSGASILVTETALLQSLGTPAIPVVCLDADSPRIDRESAENPRSDITGAHLAYVMYTSGSTGKPKGVEIAHRALNNLLQSMLIEPGLTAEDVVLAHTTVSFDIAAVELILPLMVGGLIVLVDRDTAADGERMGQLCRQHAVTVLQATPATWKLLLEAGPLPARLKALTGGEALSPNLAETLVAQGAELWNLYGPTETTVYSTCERVESISPVCIGRPIANTEVYVLDRHLQPVPVGVPGELYIGGAGLARGYRNRPELTAERFVPHPFRKDKDARVYRSGDLARWHADGRLECLGRTDYQVKIRGFRIELGEIEAVLSRHPLVRACVVVATEDIHREKRLIAHVVPAGGKRMEIRSLRRWLADELPDYMNPSAFSILSSLPRLANGKLDRSALPVPDSDRPGDERPYAAPHSPIEKLLADIWSEVLGVHRVGVHDNFFELGGHSLLAMRVVMRARGVFGVELSVRAVFEAPSVSKLSLVLLQALVAQGGIHGR